MSQGLQPTEGIPGMPGPGGDSGPARSIYLVSYPKIVFMYPTLIAALVAGVYMAFLGAGDDEARADGHVVSAIFLVVLGLNLILFSFDFPRATSLTIFFFVLALVLGALLLFRFNEDILPFLHRLLDAYRPQANATFFFSIATVLALILLAVLINVQFDYWEVTPNELLHHHGLLSNLERFAAPNLKIDKEINDVFEYFLLGSGRLILHPSREPRAIVLEHVMRINSKESELTRMLGALQVQLRPPTPPQ